VGQDLQQSSVWWRDVDEIFALFDDRKFVSELLQYLKKSHNSIKFTIKFEENGEIPFWDYLVKRCHDNALMTSIFRKKTFNSLYNKWVSFIPRKYEVNLICPSPIFASEFALHLRCFSLLSAICENFSFKMATLKE